MKLQSMKRQAVPLHAEVAAMLRHQILSGELQPGARLPALRELTAQLGVARMTVVQAMNTLADEGLIERQSGRGTFVREVETHHRHRLQMHAEMSQLHAMASDLEVSVQDNDAGVETSEVDGRRYRCMNRIHNKDGKPFCSVKIKLDDEIFQRNPQRFGSEIVVTVLKDIGVDVSSASQTITISYADFDLAQALDIKVNSAVFRVVREFYSADKALIYSAVLLYPGDLFEMAIDFSVD